MKSVTIVFCLIVLISCKEESISHCEMNKAAPNSVEIRVNEGEVIQFAYPSAGIDSSQNSERFSIFVRNPDNSFVRFSITVQSFSEGINYTQDSERSFMDFYYRLEDGSSYLSKTDIDPNGLFYNARFSLTFTALEKNSESSPIGCFEFETIFHDQNGNPVGEFVKIEGSFNFEN